MTTSGRFTRRNFVQTGLSVCAAAPIRPRAGDRPVSGSASRHAPGRRRAVTSPTDAPWSGAEPIGRRGCWSSTRPPTSSRTDPAADRAGRARVHRLHRARRADRPSCESADLLSRDLPGPRGSARAQRAADRQLPDAAARRGATRRHAGVVGRHRRPGLGHQPVVGRAAASTTRCGAPSRTCSSTAATPSTPTACSSRRSSWTTARCGRTWSPRRSRRWRRRSTTIAATTSTTCSTITCGGSTRRCRRSPSGTTTKSATTGTRPAT